MPNENTPEYIKAFYDHAANVSRGQDHVYAVRLLEKLVELRDPFYTSFALALLEQAYKRLGRDDLVAKTLKRVTELPKDQQVLLNPAWLASCYQRTGDFKGAKTILAEIRQLSPDEPYAVASMAEIALAEGRPDQAYIISESLRRRPEPAYQVLGNTLGAIALSVQGLHDSAAKELSWVGQFLISSGSIPATVWDYSDLQKLVANQTGVLAAAAQVVLNVLTGKVPLAEFTQSWSTVESALQSTSKR